MVISFKSKIFRTIIILCGDNFLETAYRQNSCHIRYLKCIQALFSACCDGGHTARRRFLRHPLGAPLSRPGCRGSSCPAIPRPPALTLSLVGGSSQLARPTLIRAWPRAGPGLDWSPALRMWPQMQDGSAGFITAAATER
jgi:hypothetical protein